MDFPFVSATEKRMRHASGDSTSGEIDGNALVIPDQFPVVDVQLANGHVKKLFRSRTGIGWSLWRGNVRRSVRCKLHPNDGMLQRQPIEGNLPPEQGKELHLRNYGVGVSEWNGAIFRAMNRKIPALHPKTERDRVEAAQLHSASCGVLQRGDDMAVQPCMEALGRGVPSGCNQKQDQQPDRSENESSRARSLPFWRRCFVGVLWRQTWHWRVGHRRLGHWRLGPGLPVTSGKRTFI